MLSSFILRNLLGVRRGNNNNKAYNGGKGWSSNFVANVVSNNENNHSSWVLNSGVTHYVTNDVTKLSNVIMFHGSYRMTIENGGKLPIIHADSIYLFSAHKHLALRNVLHALLISKN